MRKKIFSVLFALVLLLSFSLVPAVPAGAVGPSTLNVYGYGSHLYVDDGPTDWAEISIPVDIAIEDITELTFREWIESYGASGWDVNVVLGVDCDGDGFEADIAGWHQTHSPATLGDDTFVSMESPTGQNPTTGIWTEINALTTYASWTPNAAGDALGSFYGTFGNFVAGLPIGRVEAGDRVTVVKLQIGGSGSWMDETAYVDEVTINGETYYLTIQSAIDAADSGDTVNVAAGTYDENVVVDETLTLQGEDRETTIIDPRETLEPALTISADGVTVSGFTIHSKVYKHGIEYTIDVQGNSVQLTDLHVIKDKPFGGAAVIVRPGVDGFAFTDSTVDSEWNGVYVPRYEATFSSNILIQKVNFNYPGEWAVLLVAMEGAKIEENLFNCETHYGIVTNACDNIEILNNQFVGSDTANLGIWPQGFAGPVGNLTIRGNDISGFNTGINMGEELVTAGVSITDNTFQDNDVQVLDATETLNIAQVLADNTFDRAVTVDHASLLPTIWSSIQDGITAAEPDDTVNVAAGTYDENVVINETLTLQGEDRETTEIKFGYGSYPSASPLTISADEVSVSGLTIRSGPYIEPAWTIVVEGDSAELTDLHVVKEPLLWQNNTPRIGGAAIFLAPGLDGFDFNDSVVESEWNGIYMREGSSDILVKKVDFTYPGEYAILLKMITDTTIEENTFTCTADKLGVIITRGSDDIKIAGNQFAGSGLLAESHTGILLQAYAEGTMGEVTILGNDIIAFNTGILVEDVATSEISIRFNHTTGNTYGVGYIGPNTVDATNNWWGDASGPDDDAEVINGSGDKISVNVDADPWITGEIDLGAVDSADVTSTDPDPVILEDDEGNPIATVDISGGNAPSGTITAARTEEPEPDGTSLAVGTGKTGVVFLDVQVTGYTKGMAHITVPYPDDNQDGIVDGTDIEEATLGLYYWGEASSTWLLAANNTVDTINNFVSGDIPVSALQGTPGGLVGYPSDEATIAIESITNLTYSGNDIVALTITTQTAELGAATIDVTFDNTVVEVLGGENGAFDSLTVNPLFGTQTARFVANQLGPTGVDATGGAVLAQVRLKAVGNTGSSSPLELFVVTLKDNDGISIPVGSVTHGTATIGGLGDANSDGAVDVYDCVYTARAIAGIKGYSINNLVMDVDGSGEVDAFDCTYLARHIAGIVGYEQLGS